jgi:phosphoribosyl 1,2-cyclic phosphate phosphodiesterase
MNNLKVRILGSGTSHGVPVIGCACPVCRSTDPRDARTRSSILVSSGETLILVDAATEFRLQAIKAGIARISALLLTHAHADHTHGLDDLRAINDSGPIQVFGNHPTIEEIRERFAYVFKPTQEGGGKPRLALREVEGGIPFPVGGLSLLPLPILHGNLEILGYRIGSFAYITDASSIPEGTWPLLEGTEYLVINGLRKRPHPTHLSIDEAVAVAERIGPRKTWLTHLCHESSHESLLEYLSGKPIEPAYDGLEIVI